MVRHPILTALVSRDSLSGLMFIAFAAGFAFLSRDLSLGTALRMGAGYFPLLLSAVLGVLGLVIVLRALVAGGTAVEGVSWRGLALVSASVLVFGLGLGGLGLGPAVAGSTILAAMASGRARPLGIAMLAAFLVAFTWLVFIRGLGLPIPMIGSWLA
ncbi:tripartite tricarboxylate transporter TctB family protein [Azospirillum sp. RWY-5-1]|uniref:Tripartite tricarboxylate transporter TctB family protein n=1 Tax=Azospirillum oleiclasticum TaxID=2735135 RepID=A0ABX2TGW2_9PROT|nr:tripartite tricarboxylate transporter TctB family protein [Azospirillum oleiclasticum]NYZ14356.1 tripartite tricarboxylate transporter TctB family protein [Azospirillum oleiclasticum]NYZ23292.1 tripartite tricarboxylate transporter TctB family protein [Azospirillum oleiclasticum]